LIELMVTVIVLSIIMAIAFPSFRALVNSNRLTARANELLATIQYARSEAIRLNGKVTLCPTEDGSACSGADWSRLVVRLDRDDTVLREVANAGNALVSADVDDIAFSADGLARDSGGLLATANLNVCIDTTHPAQNQRVVALVSGSRVSVSQASGACP